MNHKQESDQSAPLLLGKGMSWALLVGINEYEDTQSFGRLRVCVQDATQLSAQLIASSFPEKHVKLLTDRTSQLPLRAEILAALQSIAETAEPDDLLLFYISGHGEIEHGESYLIPRNCKGGSLYDTAISIKRVKEIIAGAKARAKVIILDTCHSGADIGTKGKQPMTPEFFQHAFADAEGLAILSSCTANQLSYDWPEKECSVFTHYLLEALQGYADSENKGFVTVMDVNRYVAYQVKVWAFQQQKRQIPTLQYQVIGDIILLHYKSQEMTHTSLSKFPEEKLATSSEEILTRYFGDLQALREGRVHQNMIEQLAKEQGITPRDEPQQATEDILERYNRVPLHAILLHTSEDKEIIAYLKEHFAALQSLFEDVCDIHLLVDQFTTPQNYNAYTLKNSLHMVKLSDLPPYVELPAIIFWDHHGTNAYISFAPHPDATIIRNTLRTISDEIHQEATMDAIRRAKANLRHQAAREVEEKQYQKPVVASKQEEMDNTQIDIGILIALPEEFDVFYPFIKSRSSTTTNPASGETLFLFESPTSGKQPPYRCIAGLIGEKGPIEAALTTSAMLQQWNPRTMVMLGIAAGIHEDIRLGDIIVARSIDSYIDQGKVRSSKKQQSFDLHFSGQVYQCSSSLITFLNTFKYTYSNIHQNWQQNCDTALHKLLQTEAINSLQQEGQLRALPEYTIGHLASGPLVVASTPFKQTLIRRNRDFLGIEMEAGGMMPAIRRRIEPRNSVVLRGVSDFGDERKKDLEGTTKNALRNYAMYSATQLFWQLMIVGAFPYANQKSTPDIHNPVHPSAPQQPTTLINQANSTQTLSASQFDRLNQILTHNVDDLELQEICRAVNINYQSLDDRSHAMRAFSLTRKMENQVRLDELEHELRRRLPRQFSDRQ